MANTKVDKEGMSQVQTIKTMIHEIICGIDRFVERQTKRDQHKTSQKER